MTKKCIAILLVVALLCPLTVMAASGGTPEGLDEMYNRVWLADYFFGGFTRSFIEDTMSNLFGGNDYLVANPVPAKEFEEALYARFTVSDEDLLWLRTQYGYDETNYYVSINGGFGSMMPEREIAGYEVLENGSVKFYFHKIVYDWLPDSAYEQMTDFPSEYTYNGQVYHASMDGYYRIAGYEDRGMIYITSYQNGIVKCISYEKYDAGDMPQTVIVYATVISPPPTPV